MSAHNSIKIMHSKHGGIVEYKIKTELINEFMEKNSLTNSEFCKMCAITPKILEKIFAHDYSFRWDELLKICKSSGIKFAELFA